MSFTRLQLGGPQRLSEFGTATTRSRHETERGRMSLSRFAQFWHEQQNTEHSKTKPPKPYARNRCRACREKEAAQTLER